MIVCGDFSTALRRLKEGHRVARELWRACGGDFPVYLSLEAGTIWAWHSGEKEDFCANSCDMLAEDWYVVGDE